MQSVHTRYPQWTWWDALIMLGAFVVIYSISIPLQFGVASLTGELKEFQNSDNPSIPESALIVNHIGKAIGLIGGVWIVGTWRKKHTWTEIGLRPTTAKWLWRSLLIGIVMFGIRLLMAKALVAAIPEFKIGSAGIFLDNQYSLGFNLMLLLIIGIVVPVSEEIFFRGFLFQWMCSRHRFAVAVFFSSLMFAVSHFIPIQVVMSFILSVLITLVFARTGSLWNAIAIHATNNFVSAIAALLVSGQGAL